MIPRLLLPNILQSLREFPVVGLLGPRQVGKTTLGKTIMKEWRGKAIYLDLELPSDLNKLTDAELYFKQTEDKLVIIDEIQRMPSLFPLLRALVDQKKSSGRFLILGSASPELIKHASETLAGRIFYFELQPLSLQEIKNQTVPLNTLWLRGGYPDSLLAQSDESSYRWRTAFLQTYLERDIPQLGIKTPALQLHRFLTMVAHVNGQLWNASHIGGSLGVSGTTIQHYVDIFTETFLLHSLRPYHINIKKRLVKRPKIYFKDSGMLHAMLGIKTMEDLASHPILGHSWEGFAIQQIIASGIDAQTFFYRSIAGAEIDLLLIDSKKKPVAVEIKYSLSPQPKKDFWNAFNDLGCDRGYIVYPGDEKVRLRKNLELVPLGKMGEMLGTPK